ncbi:hypothetical protein Cni_G28255 [Canna indica]|uniref:Uncharacterized protein n=1 Tax=Canna indica TaxID=4628 RepID=A0AAQ3L985_9LILI|nr:hypothetical protein Cni_G28255 [Canna indica]
MLSTKNPPDPSCSSKLPVVRGGESASEKVAFQGENTILEETTTPNFSIRDYVFASRSKDIETSWPFSQNFLQLCLKHGVKDPLPPFEPPGLVRIQYQRKVVKLVEPVVCSYAEPQGKEANIREDSCSLLEKTSPDEKLVTCKRISKPELAHYGSEIGFISPHGLVEKSSTEIGGVFGSLAKHRSISEAPTKKLESSCIPITEKKCRLIVKLGVNCENNRAEEKISNSSIVSDPMASKVCPVCRTFSSTSNTTLNAHIDQCLSMEPYNKSVSRELLKPKEKSRKKRLMVDIYATAPHCTLEDLDKRNGTNWANELAFVAAPVGVALETSKPKLVPLDSQDEAKAGAIYVDSKGVKLGIISKLEGKPQSQDELKLHQYSEVIDISRKFLISKKKHLSTKCSKKMKVKTQIKKLSSCTKLKTQIQTAIGVDAEVHHENGEPLLHVSEPKNLSKSSTSASLRQWICSRRSDLPKKLVDRSVHRAPNSTEPLTRSKLAESDPSDVCNSSVAIRRHLKVSRLSEDSACPPKTNKIEFLSKAAHCVDDIMRNSRKMPISSSGWSSENTSERRSLVLRTSKPSRNFVASSRSKVKEFELCIQHKSDSFCDSTNIPSEICHSSVKNRSFTTWKKNDSVRTQPFNLVTRTDDQNDEPSACNTFRKRRSISRSGKTRAEFQSATSGVRGPGFDNAITGKLQRLSEFDHSKIARLSGEGDLTSSSPLGRDVPGFEERDDRCAIEEQKCCSSPDAAHSDMQVEVLESENYVRKPTLETAAGNPISYDSMHSKIPQTIIASTPMIEHSQFVSKSEVHEELFNKISEKQEVCCNVASREIDGQNIRVADEREESTENDSNVALPTECTVDTMPIHESSVCLTTTQALQPEVPQKGSSIASLRSTADDAINLASDDEPCISPALTASIPPTISFPSPKNSKYTESDAEPFTAISVQDKSGSEITEDNVEAVERNADVRNEELEVKLPSNILDLSVDGKPFCCSCRESLSRETQLFRPNNAYGPTKGRQVSNSFSGLRISSSFSAYQNHNTNAMISSDLQPAAQSTSMKGLPDSAVKVTTFSALGSATPSQSQNQSISNPILRLMGKNLMVVNNEEFGQSSTVSLDYPPHGNLLTPLGFSSTNNHLKHGNFQYHHQILGGSPVFNQAAATGELRISARMPSTPMVGFSMTSLRTSFAPRPDQHTQQVNAFTRPNISSAPYLMNEVILIDDSHGGESGRTNSPFAGLNISSQRPFSYFSSQCHPNDLHGGPRSSLPNPYMGANANLMERGSTSECHSPLLSNPFVFPSPTAPRMHSSVCYSQLRRS